MCPHCVALQPTWNTVREQLGANGGIILAEVEYEHMSMLPASLRNIRGFPTIQMLQNGRVKDEYSGDRSTQSIVDFALSYAVKPKPTPAPKSAPAKVAAAAKKPVSAAKAKKPASKEKK